MLTDIELTSNNVKLLSEMLKSYCSGSSSSNDLELIKELYNTVKQLEPKVKTMLSLEIPENEDTVSKYFNCDYVWLIYFDCNTISKTYQYVIVCVFTVKIKKKFIYTIFNHYQLLVITFELTIKIHKHYLTIFYYHCLVILQQSNVYFYFYANNNIFHMKTCI